MPDPASVTALQRALEQRLELRWGSAVGIDGLAELAGGASRQTTRFVARTGTGERALVLRRDLAGAAGAAEMNREAEAMAAAAKVGVPVPEIVDSGADLLGTPFIVMGYVEGESIPRRLLREETFAAIRPTMAHELGRLAARIHTMSLAEAPSLQRPDPLAMLRQLSERYDEPRPTVELALHWLQTNRSPATVDTVVHGDLRNGNILVGPDGIRGVLDWELVHRGDPVEDLGWLCVKAWRFGSAEAVGGFGSRQQLLDGYASVAGWRPTEAQLHWWEVYGHLHWVLLCRLQAAIHLHGKRDSLEHAVIGRRVCEAEFDLLLSLGLAEPVAQVDPLDGVEELATLTRAATPHDAPDADHLLAVVQRFLSEGSPTHTDGPQRFLARVAANAIRIARRELLLQQGQGEEHRRRLNSLGFADDAAFATAIRAAAIDPLGGEAVAAIRAAVLEKLLVANPRYSSQPG
ncbi:aminoglycoside phosphotransferase (APT) family kinase protein [Jatrophihabitans sp. GAS493]|uniref:phosphotransferase family protein n=1 Tax=Jatrophihabitans sp. GAS493 TaxID=1907575 RepID=UPI000BB77524|nr:phosphotransferase family protein [Jatrophihabitans sp. GAS493]SOD71818.1 aminoglycoside phosphotransferase (APT) family kinase protein [Jatrophihabitans sp. GAS493]